MTRERKLIAAHNEGRSFVVETPAYRSEIDRSGSLRSLTLSGGVPLLTSNGRDAWRARQNNGQIRVPSQLPQPKRTWSNEEANLKLHFADHDLDVIVFFQFRARHIDLWAEIRRIEGDTLKYFFLPDGLEFPVDDLRQFLFPRTFGVSLSPDFFRSFRRMEGGYPGPMDFLHIDSVHGQLSLYGIQPLRDRTPFAHDEPFLVPGRLSVSGIRRRGPHAGLIGHGWNIWIKDGETFTTPRYRLAIVEDWWQGVRDYGEANQITRSLADKLGDDLNAVQRAYVVKFEKDTFAELAAALSRLPAPSIVHFAGHLPNGFDRYYPQHLPIHPDMGGGEGLASLCGDAQATGHKVMPYTNYTWWCYDTPYLTEHGTNALQQRVDGCPILEHYYEQIGYAASMWSPIHRRIMLDEVETFREYGVDILSVDQMSARPFRPPFMTEDYWWDHNPACPTPNAAVQGMADAAKVLSEMVPLSTEVWENGPIDYLTNWCMQFCAYHVEGFDSEDTRFAPLIHALAHDKTIFTWHDLVPDTSVWNDYRLTLSLLLGFQLIYIEGSRGEPARAHRKLFVQDPTPDEAQWPDAETLDWLAWLHQLSTAICAHYIGQPLTSFSYQENQVLEATYGPVTIVANLKQTAHTFSDDVVIAAQGFYARHEGVEAGILDRFHEQSGERMRVLSLN